MPRTRSFLLPAVLALTVSACADHAAPSQALWPDAPLPFAPRSDAALEGPPVRLFQAAADNTGRVATFVVNSTGQAQSVTYTVGGQQNTTVLQPGEIREVGTGGGSIVSAAPVARPAGGGQ